jgi:hypothetical protein
MSTQVNDFFQNNKDVIGKTHQAIDSASSTGERANAISVPGSYIMKVKTVVAKKKDGELLISPKIGLSDSLKSKGALQLHFLLEVTEPTEAVEKGATVFHTITLAQPNGATDEKIRNTSSFMKPIVCALIGKDRFDLTPEFVHGTMEIDYDETTLKITRNHGLTQPVMVVCEEYVKANNQQGIRVKSVRALRPGDKSISVKQAASENADLAQTAKAIEGSAGQVTVESTDLDYDPKMDTSEFQVEDA